MPTRTVMKVGVLVGSLFLAPVSAAEVDYIRDVKPILQARCFACHGAVRQKSGLRLDAGQLILKGGKSGPVVVPGKSDESRLVDLIRGEDGERMPPEAEGAALTSDEIKRIETWIDQGAKVPDEPIPGDPKRHWAFQPPVRAAVPPLPNKERTRNPIDAFVNAERARHNIAANPPADRPALLRRVYLDLIGVPPSREELHSFLNDPAPDAYENVVDRLLADPRHGERWGRHWMDVWRYSDPFGLGEEYRYSQRHIWHWRDWIIDALNADKGYDRMILEMIAGDELAPADPETLRATGYLARNWYKFNRNAWLQDTVEHTATGFLGLTLRCTRCHDHKYDPISQRDYYAFRAFFEPHDVRLDPVPGQPDVKLDGIPRAFDAQPAAPTYLFARGDDRSPDKEHPLDPAIPSVLGNAVNVSPVTFSHRDYLQALGPAEQNALPPAQAEATTAEQELAKARLALANARAFYERFPDDPNAPPPPEAVPSVFLEDSFASALPDVWKPISGQWAWEKGRLVQRTPSHFATLVTRKNHPPNLLGRVRYRTTGGGTTSVGFAFDVVGTTAWQAVYTHTKPASSAIQAFHRVDSKEAYPNEGIVPASLKLNEEIIVDFAVRDTLLNVWVNGQLKIVYRLPVARRDGAFALWNHDATSEFNELRLLELPSSVTLTETLGEARPSPFDRPLTLTKEDAKLSVARAEASYSMAELKRDAAAATVSSIELRAAADRAKHSEPPNTRYVELASAAARSERRAAMLRAKMEITRLEGATAPAGSKAASELDAKRTAARKALDDATASATKTDSAYTPLARLEPASSTGRRKALAAWITDRGHPLTARVAVNHVWLRHFGKPIVPTVANFGLNGKPPTHPELLDWLAVEFMESGWSFKHLHRLIVTSETYRLSSRPGSPSAQLAADPDNRYLWRMNPRRMEGEVVRDSLLACAGALDTKQGGPILDEKQGQTILRRSLYFRFNTEYKMLLLEQFDPASPSECYERHESVIPQQALTLTNSALALSQARRVARRLSEALANDPAGSGDASFVTAAFEQVLSRPPTAEERTRSERFLRDQTVLLKDSAKQTSFPAVVDAVLPPSDQPAQRAREDLIHVLFNHHEFVTIR